MDEIQKAFDSAMQSLEEVETLIRDLASLRDRLCDVTTDIDATVGMLNEFIDELREGLQDLGSKIDEFQG